MYYGIDIGGTKIELCCFLMKKLEKTFIPSACQRHKQIIKIGYMRSKTLVERADAPLLVKRAQLGLGLPGFC